MKSIGYHQNVAPALHDMAGDLQNDARTCVKRAHTRRTICSLNVRRRATPHGSQGPVEPALICQRDDGLFEILPAGSGPFPTRMFAEAVAAKTPRAL